MITLKYNKGKGVIQKARNNKRSGEFLIILMTKCDPEYKTINASGNSQGTMIDD